MPVAPLPFAFSVEQAQAFVEVDLAPRFSVGGCFPGNATELGLRGEHNEPIFDRAHRDGSALRHCRS